MSESIGDEPTVQLNAEDMPGSEDLTIEFTQDELEQVTSSAASIEADVSNDVTLDFETPGEDTDDLKNDLGENTSETGMDMDLTNEFTLDEENTDSMSEGFDLELQEDEEEELIPNTELDIDMEGTVEMPKIDYVDDEDDKTVFIPRSASSEQQSLEDEVSTKLDLAKAYVELGDNDSAKTILDEIVAEGNAEQKQIAEQLLSQVP